MDRVLQKYFYDTEYLPQSDLNAIELEEEIFRNWTFPIAKELVLNGAIIISYENGKINLNRLKEEEEEVVEEVPEPEETQDLITEEENDYYYEGYRE